MNSIQSKIEKLMKFYIDYRFDFFVESIILGNYSVLYITLIFVGVILWNETFY